MLADHSLGVNINDKVIQRDKITEPLVFIKLELEMDGGVIRSCMLSGDYFTLKDGLCEKLDALLRGAEDNKEALRERLGGLDLSEYVRDLWLDDLLDALYPART